MKDSLWVKKTDALLFDTIPTFASEGATWLLANPVTSPSLLENGLFSTAITRTIHHFAICPVDYQVPQERHDHGSFQKYLIEV